MGTQGRALPGATHPARTQTTSSAGLGRGGGGTPKGSKAHASHRREGAPRPAHRAACSLGSSLWRASGMCSASLLDPVYPAPQDRPSSHHQRQGPCPTATGSVTGEQSKEVHSSPPRPPSCPPPIWPPPGLQRTACLEAPSHNTPATPPRVFCPGSSSGGPWAPAVSGSTKSTPLMCTGAQGRGSLAAPPRAQSYAVQPRTTTFQPNHQHQT